MSVDIPPRAVTFGGLALVLLAGILGATAIITTPFTGCTDVGVGDAETTGPEFHGLEDGNIVYSPDGVNECGSPVEVAIVPLGSFGIGVGLLAWSYVGSD